MIKRPEWPEALMLREQLNQAIKYSNNREALELANVYEENNPKTLIINNSNKRIFSASLLFLLLLIILGVIYYFKILYDLPIAVNTSHLPILPVLKGDNVEKSSDGFLTIAIEHNEYKIGDRLNMEYAVTKSIYIRLFYINSSGDKGELLPDREDSAFLVPGVVYHYPPLDAKYEINIEGPKGIDQIVAIASEKPIPYNLGSYILHNENLVSSGIYGIYMKPNSFRINIVRLKYLVK